MAVPPLQPPGSPPPQAEIKITAGKIMIADKEHRVTVGGRRVTPEELAADLELQKKVLKLLSHVVIAKSLESGEKLQFSKNKVELLKGSTTSPTVVNFREQYKQIKPGQFKITGQAKVKEHYEKKFTALEKYMAAEKKTNEAIATVGNKYTSATMQQALNNILNEPVGFDDCLREGEDWSELHTASLPNTLHMPGKEGILTAVLSAAKKDNLGTAGRPDNVTNCENELRQELAKLIQPGSSFPLGGDTTGVRMKLSGNSYQQPLRDARSNVEQFLKSNLGLEQKFGQRAILSPQLGLQHHISHLNLTQAKVDTLNTKIRDLQTAHRSATGADKTRLHLEIFALKCIANTWADYHDAKEQLRTGPPQGSPRRPPPGPRMLREDQGPVIELDATGDRSPSLYSRSYSPSGRRSLPLRGSPSPSSRSYSPRSRSPSPSSRSTSPSSRSSSPGSDSSVPLGILRPHNVAQNILNPPSTPPKGDNR